jgi:hypothetical protein
MKNPFAKPAAPIEKIHPPASFPYVSPKWSNFFMVLLCGIGFPMTLMEAINPRPMVINRIIHLPPLGGAIVFWIMALFCVLGFVVGIYSLINSFKKPGLLTINENSISFPSAFLSKPQDIEYSNITALNEHSAGSSKILVITLRNRKMVNISSDYLKKGEYEGICIYMTERITALETQRLFENPIG